MGARGSLPPIVADFLATSGGTAELGTVFPVSIFI